MANEGWRFKELLTPEEEKAVESEVRHSRVHARAQGGQEYYRFDQPGEYVLSDATKAQYAVKDYQHPARR